MAQHQGPRSYKTLFDLHLYLAGKYCENPKVPGAQLSVNPARAITWFVGVTNYCTFFNNNLPRPGHFLCSNILLKSKLATVRGMLIEQIFELKGLGPPGRICTPISGCFHDKTIISKENFWEHLLLKYCRRQCTLLPFTWAKSLTKFNPKMQDSKQVLDLNCEQKKNWTT